MSGGANPAAVPVGAAPNGGNGEGMAPLPGQNDGEGMAPLPGQNDGEGMAPLPGQSTDNVMTDGSTGADDPMTDDGSGMDEPMPAEDDVEDSGDGGSTSGAGGSGGQDDEVGAGGPGGAGGQMGSGGMAGDPPDEETPINCVGQAFTTADPTSPGPFQVTADKEVGPLAGVVPDPIYGDEQQRFNVYRPSNLGDSGYCHPILIWANGYRDNPEQKPPDCIVNQSDQWCGQYSPLLNHLASHGFVVVASLSTATAEGDPLPTTAGLDWIIEQADDPSSPYYQRLDTSKIGQLGHSYGGMSTSMTASDPRFSALATICGARTPEGVHTPMLFFCGGRDGTVECPGIQSIFETVTDEPAFFMNQLDADHGSWVYDGPGGVSLSASAAWFRAHLMDDTESRGFFYGSGCRFCSDNRVQVEQNSLMAQ